MEIYKFVWHMLAWSITIAVLGFVTFPWAMLSYKIWHGSKPIDEELGEELLQRSWYAGWTLGAVAIVILLLDYLIIDQLGIPSGPVHIVFFLCLLALAAWIMFYFFSMEDFFAGLSLTVIYLYIPMAVLFVLWWLIGWNWLFTYLLSWLKEPKI